MFTLISLIDTGTENGLQSVNDESAVADNYCSSNGWQDKDPSEQFGYPMEKVVFYDIF